MNASAGISMKIMATLCATLMLACVKALDGTIPVGEVIFFRSVIALIPLMIWLRVQGSIRKGIRTENIKGHFIRGLAGTASMFLTYLSLLYISLTDATALNYTAPLFTVLMAALILRESVGYHRWVAVAAGFAGILIMSLPHMLAASDASLASSFGVLLALLAAICSASAYIQIRALNTTESAGSIAFWFAIMTALTSLVTLVAGWKIPNSQQLMLLIGCGLFGGCTQILLTLSLRLADASLLAPFDYTTLVWSVLIGFLFLGSVPESTTLYGAGLVALGGLFSILYERRQRARLMVERS